MITGVPGAQGLSEEAARSDNSEVDSDEVPDTIDSLCKRWENEYQSIAQGFMDRYDMPYPMIPYRPYWKDYPNDEKDVSEYMEESAKQKVCDVVDVIEEEFADTEPVVISSPIVSTEESRRRIAKGETLDEIMPETQLDKAPDWAPELVEVKEEVYAVSWLPLSSHGDTMGRTSSGEKLFATVNTEGSVGSMTIYNFDDSIDTTIRYYGPGNQPPKEATESPFPKEVSVPKPYFEIVVENKDVQQKVRLVYTLDEGDQYGDEQTVYLKE